jgi:hypothetical protein
MQLPEARVFEGRRVRIARWVCTALLVAAAGLSSATVRGAVPIPGPIGGPEVAVDVNTMIGKQGPSFVLQDGDRRTHRVSPGATGRALVIISHMGFY